jgi:hypothetical protein
VWRFEECNEDSNLAEVEMRTEDESTGMGCVLRVRGDEFDIDNVLSRIKITPCHVQTKGFPRFGPKSKIAQYTGFNVATSDASERDLAAQVRDTIGFLRIHGEELALIMSFAGITVAELDFAVECRIGRNDVFAQNDYLPPELLLLAGKLGIGINFTLYPARNEVDELDRASAGDAT